MRKLIIIALVAAGFIGLTLPESKAGVSVGIGIGFPGVYGYPGYGYPYGYPAAYPYGAPYYQPVVYYSAVYGPYYWWHGHRVFIRHRHFWR